MVNNTVFHFVGSPAPFKQKISAVLTILSARLGTRLQSIYGEDCTKRHSFNNGLNALSFSHSRFQFSREIEQIKKNLCSTEHGANVYLFCATAKRNGKKVKKTSPPRPFRVRRRCGNYINPAIKTGSSSTSPSFAKSLV